MNPDKWIGQIKTNMINTWGPPVRIFKIDKKGEILIYAHQIFTPSNKKTYRNSNPYFWKYTYIYINKQGEIFAHKTEKQNYPPQLVDPNKVILLITG